MAMARRDHSVPLLIARQDQDGLGVVLLDAEGAVVGCLGHSPVIATTARLRGWYAFQGGEGWMLGLRADIAPETLPLVPHGHGWRRFVGIERDANIAKLPILGLSRG